MGLQVVRPIKTFMHPAWNGKVQSGNDIALLRLAKPSRHRPIAFNPVKNKLHTGQKLAALGWGLTVNGQLSRFLRQAPSLEYISPKNCRKGFQQISLPDGVVCTYTENQDTCKGIACKQLPINRYGQGLVTFAQDIKFLMKSFCGHVWHTQGILEGL